MSRFRKRRIFLILLILSTFCLKQASAQISGSLFLMEENFQSQMLNPSFMRTDGASILAFPVFAGGNVGNSANFKLSDLIRIQENGSPVLDIEHFYNTGNVNNKTGQWASIPIFYFAKPFNDGMISVYWKEQIQTSFQFNLDVFEFLMNGNTEPEYRAFNAQDMSSFSMGYKEIAFGYTQNINEKFRIGGRIKLLFGEALLELNDWNYGINTSESGDLINLSSSGRGRLSIPARLKLDEERRIQGILSSNVFQKYLTSFHNPGLAIDLGITLNPSKAHSFTLSAIDFGTLWYRKNTSAMIQNESYDFSGFDISHSLDAHIRNGYVSTLDVMLGTKEEIRNVFRPKAETKRFLQTIAPKTILNYHYKRSSKLSYGISNQTVFLKNNILNVAALSSKQKIQNLSVFESVNLYGLNDVSIGAGVQWESKHAQIFFATDNLLAVYHPAANRSYSFSFGISLLLNHFPEEIKEERASPKGSTSKYLPFFRKRK